MDNMHINPIAQTQNVVQTTNNAPQVEGDFKFILASNVSEAELSQRLTELLTQIEDQGKKISKKTDIGDMRRYRALIKDFLNEVVNRSHEFSRENFLDRRGRHRVYGIIRQVDDVLDSLAQELVKEEKDNIAILNKCFLNFIFNNYY